MYTYRHEIINKLIERNGYKYYLEIGLNNPESNFLLIDCEHKESCDPYFNDSTTDVYVDEQGHISNEKVEECLTYHMTSDEMFEHIDSSKKWDIVFIDGLHEGNQVVRDIINSLKHLNKNGCIVLHDCLPLTEEQQLYPRPEMLVGDIWNGDVWRGVYSVSKIPGIELKVVNSDFGVGILTFDGNEDDLFYPDKTDLPFSVFDEKWTEMFRVISPEDFMENEYESYVFELRDNVYRFHKKCDTDKYVVFTCAKNEKDYIREYVEHYLNLGFDKVVIANNDDDQSILNTILCDLIKSDKVQIFNLSGVERFQCEIYTMFMNYGNYRWCAYFDCDEFLELTCEYGNIKGLLDTIDSDIISFNWVVYGANNEFKHENKQLCERFKKPVYPLTSLKDNMFIKSIIKNTVKGGYFNSSHVPFVECKKTVGGYEEYNGELYTHWPLCYKSGYIKHYYTKSFEEYEEKKKRGWPDGNDAEKLKNSIIFHMLNEGDSFNRLRLLGSLFSDEIDFQSDNPLDEHDVIFIKSSNNNNYAIYGYTAKLMCLCENKTFVVPTDIDNSLFTELLGISIMTNNKLITCIEDNDRLWNVFLNNTDGSYDTYYKVNVF